jgi:iron-sulfur cluster repair protein YtfE (RIC family)
MTADTLASALEREHREIDRGVAAYLEGTDTEEARAHSLLQAMAALRRHIFLEEEFLFPPLRDAGFVAPIFVMLREHGELWRTMEAIDGELADDGGPPPRAQCKVLLALLAKHNAKEEPILYPHADSVLDAPAGEELRTFLDRGRLPDGWVCSGAAS